MIAGDLHAIRHHVVATLPQLLPEAVRAERMRTRCMARLMRDRRRSSRFASISRFGRHLVLPAITAGLFVLYAADLLTATLRVFTA